MLAIRTFGSGVFVAVALLADVDAQASKGEARPASVDSSDSSLGLSFSASTTQTGQDIVVDFDVVRTPIRRGMMAIDSVSSRDDYLRFSGTTASVQVGDNSFRFHTSNLDLQRVSHLACYLCVSYSIVDYSLGTRSPRLKAEQLETLKSNLDQFFRLYGDGYVSSVLYGRRLDVCLEFSFDTMQQLSCGQTEIKAAVSGLKADELEQCDVKLQRGTG